MSKKVEVVDKFELTTIEKSDALQVFTGGGIDPILEAITNEVRSHTPNVSTPKGRKEIASLSYKVSQSKTLLESAGKSLVAEWKEKSKRVDEVRKHTRDSLDMLRDEARAPLTEWEEEEKEREVAEKLACEVAEAETEAHQQNEIINREREVARKEAAIEAAAEAKRQQEEARHLEAERIEREERIRAEAKELAEREAAEAIERAEREKYAAEQARIEAEEKAKKDAAYAEESAKRAKEESERKIKEEKELAIRVERERVIAEEEAEKRETEKRERDRAHKAQINNAAIEAIIKATWLSKVDAKKVVVAICKNEIPNTKINY